MEKIDGALSILPVCVAGRQTDRRSVRIVSTYRSNSITRSLLMLLNSSTGTTGAMSRYYRQGVLLVTVAVASAGAFVPADAIVSSGSGGRRRFPWDCRGGGGRRIPVANDGSSEDASPSESIHLQLRSPAMMASMRNSNNEEDGGDKAKFDGDVPESESEKEPEDGPTLIKFRTYHVAASLVPDADGAATIFSLGMPLRKFKLFIHSNTGIRVADIDEEQIVTEDVDLKDSAVRKRMRDLWHSGANIITDRTEFLAVYESESEHESGGRVESDAVNAADEQSSTSSVTINRQRGDFADLLSMYAERLVGIIEDEKDEDAASAEKASRIQKMMLRNMTEVSVMERNLKDGVSGGLLGYLRREYGEAETDGLLAENLLASGTTKEEKYAQLQHFLDWFRDRFPYYYDRCSHCGASAKDDGYLDPSCRATSDDDNGESKDNSDSTDEDCSTVKNEKDQEDDEKDDGTTFLGYVYPNEKERRGKAGRTEVYSCHKCGAISRFPRYNSASSVLRSQRGRCGEYSMLILRLFRALGHEARWVVDWSDHVWAEIRLFDDWIHVDPCEAAIDNPLLYESWGKTQTYIVAFHPSLDSSQADRCIEDVTATYTSDNTTVIGERREDPAELIETSLVDTRKALQTKLRDVLCSVTDTYEVDLARSR